MELKSYITIFRQQMRIFLACVIVTLSLVLLWQISQPERLQATLLINIGRVSVPETPDYAYDSFYRLQADERFGDTVVRWLGSPRVVEDILAAAGLNPHTLDTATLRHVFTAKRLSSQVVEVTYADTDPEHLQKIAAAGVMVLNQYTESLNRENREANWFVVIGSEPVIRDERIALPLALAVGLGFGIFIGFWAALFSHYLRHNSLSTS